MLSKRKKFSFAIGGPDGRQSDAWRVIVHGNDVYINQATLRYKTKFSLHVDGKWYFSNLDSYWKNKNRPNAERHISKWLVSSRNVNRTVTVRIVFPEPDLKNTASPDSFVVDTRIPIPEINHAVIVLLVFLADGASLPSKIDGLPITPMWFTQMSSGHTFTLGWTTHLLQEEHLLVLKKLRAKAMKTDIPPGPGRLRSVSANQQEDGGLAIFELNLP